MKNLISKQRKRILSFVLMLALVMTGSQLPAKESQAASTTSCVPISCYTRVTGKVITYTSSSLGRQVGYIVASDYCTILAIYSNGALKVKYPVNKGYRTAYASSSNFFQNVNFSTSTKKLGKRLTAYRRSTGSATIGTVYASDKVIITGVANGRTQVIYPAGSGYKLGWVSGNYKSSNSSVTSSTTLKSILFNATYYANKYPDLKAAYGYNATSLYTHYLQYGIKEGRSASPVFDPVHYLNHNADLIQAFGRNNYTAAYTHFIQYGYKEYRNSSPYYWGGYYKGRYSDLAALNMSSLQLLQHYIQYGISERRWANSSGLIPDMGQSQSAVSSGSTVTLNVPSYKQYDSRWKKTYIGNKTIGQIGCLLTSISMKYSYSTGTTVYPNQMKGRLSFSNNDLYWSSVSRLGYSYTGQYNCRITNSMMSTIYSKLKANKPIIIGGKTAGGSTHWVVVKGYKGSSTSSFSASNFTINDPNSSSRTTLAQFLNSYPYVLRIIY